MQVALGGVHVENGAPVEKGKGSKEYTPDNGKYQQENKKARRHVGVGGTAVLPGEGLDKPHLDTLGNASVKHKPLRESRDCHGQTKVLWAKIPDHHWYADDRHQDVNSLVCSLK